MPRKRHQKRQIKTVAPAPQTQSREYSPAAQAIAQRMVNGDVDYFEHNLTRAVIDSVELAEEPEFMDLFLNDQQVARVTERWFTKYDERLATAKKKSQDDYQEAIDEMIDRVIDELATPTFRNDVNQRLRILMDRLMVGNDTRKLEMVMLLIPALRMKKFPWGLCGLVQEIYHRTIQRTMQEYEEDQVVFDAVEEVLNAEGADKTDIEALLKNPDKLEQIGKKIFEARPGLRQRAEKQIWDMIKAFEDALAHGDVELSLFSEEELMLPFQRLQIELGEPLLEVQQSEEISKKILDTIQQVITDIMTPERFRRFREDVDNTAAHWSRTQHKWGAALNLELGYLDGDQYEENKFFLAVFIGQISRLGKEHKSAAKKKKR